MVTLRNLICRVFWGALRSLGSPQGLNLGSSESRPRLFESVNRKSGCWAQSGPIRNPGVIRNPVAERGPQKGPILVLLKSRAMAEILIVPKSSLFVDQKGSILVLVKYRAMAEILIVPKSGPFVDQKGSILVLFKYRAMACEQKMTRKWPENDQKIARKWLETWLEND